MSQTNTKHRINKDEIKSIIKNYILVTLGCFCLAFGDGVFLTPCNIVSGGVSSIGIIGNYFIQKQWPGAINFNSIIVTSLEIILLIVGFFVLGKRFAARTLYASLIYPVFFSLLYDFKFGELIGLTPLYDQSNAAYMLMSALFGGALVGVGVALGYSGAGSTGGLDVISGIIAKYTDMKQDVSGFIIDAIIIVVGMVSMKSMIGGLYGIVAAFCCALSVQFVFIYLNSFVIVDIISYNYELIQQYIHKEMDHATTIIDTVGGYTGEKRKMIRVVIYHNEIGELRNYIASVDPRAFISFTEAKTINGEGFEPLMIHTHKHRTMPEAKALQQNTISPQKPTENKENEPK
jgi:uncharacterized membrane-anchored protein YitT (DUF2179 family)